MAVFLSFSERNDESSLARPESTDIQPILNPGRWIRVIDWITVKNRTQCNAEVSTGKQSTMGNINILPHITLIHAGLHNTAILSGISAGLRSGFCADLPKMPVFGFQRTFWHVACV